MRETFTHVVAEKQRFQRHAHRLEQQLKASNIEAVIHENERLKQLLQVNGITYDRLLPTATALPTPTSSESQAFGYSQPSIPNGHRAPSANQSSSPNGHPHVFNSQQSPFPNAPTDLHTSLRQYSGGPPTMSTPELQRASSNETTTASPVASTSSHASSTGGFPKPPSIPGSTFASSFPSPLPNTVQPPQPHGASSNYFAHSHQIPKVIDKVVSDPSNFHPPLGQRSVNGRVVRNGSDERIQQRDINHDQLGVDFVLA